MSLIHQGTETVDIHLTLAWTTRSRIPVLKNEAAVTARTAVREVCTVYEVKIIEGVAAEDYICVRLQCPSTVAVHDLAERLKARSDAAVAELFPDLRRRFGDRSIWSTGYFCVSTAGGGDLETYLNNQRTADEQAISISPVN